jgi:hypothetical protein
MQQLTREAVSKIRHHTKFFNATRMVPNSQILKPWPIADVLVEGEMFRIWACKKKVFPWAAGVYVQSVNGGIAKIRENLLYIVVVKLKDELKCM